jgi:hypothetical protein
MKQQSKQSQRRSRDSIAANIRKMLAPVIKAEELRPPRRFQGQPRQAGRKQRNQHGRTNFDWRFQLRMLAGTCPFCHFNSGYIGDLSVIYRMSDHSVTFRCQYCTLQWTMTFVTLQRAAKIWSDNLRTKGKLNSVHLFDCLAETLKDYAKRDANRKSSIQRVLQNPLRKRRVIRLPDKS